MEHSYAPPPPDAPNHASASPAPNPAPVLSIILTQRQMLHAMPHSHPLPMLLLRLPLPEVPLAEMPMLEKQDLEAPPPVPHLIPPPPLRTSLCGVLWGFSLLAGWTPSVCSLLTVLHPPSCLLYPALVLVVGLLIGPKAKASPNAQQPAKPSRLPHLSAANWVDAFWSVLWCYFLDPLF